MKYLVYILSIITIVIITNIISSRRPQHHRGGHLGPPPSRLGRPRSVSLPRSRGNCLSNTTGQTLVFFKSCK